MQTAKSDLSTAFAEILQSVATSPLPDRALQVAKDRVLDALSVTFDGLDEPSARVAFRSIDARGGACTVIGRDATAPASDAAFVNAVASHATAQADYGGGGHPGTYVVPVSLALAEQNRCSGQALLSAIAVGYEAAERMHMAVGPATHSNGFRAVSTIGPFAAAASASVLSGFDTDRLATAMKFAASMAGGFYQCLGDGTMEAHFAAGFAARAGIVGAALAGAAGEAAPGALDGAHGFFAIYADSQYDASALTATKRELGILRARSKPFPACAANIDTMLMIRSLQSRVFSPSEIDHVVVTRPATGQNGYDAPGIAAEPPYLNMLQAQMSAKFTAVAALLGKPITESRYFHESFADPDVAEVARRTSLLANRGDTDAITVEVVLRDGSALSLRSADVPGLSWNMDVPSMFERLVSPRLHGASQRVFEMIANLESAPNIGELMQLVKV